MSSPPTMASLDETNYRAQPASLSSTGQSASANTNGATMKDTAINTAANAINTVKDHPITQNIANGPVATSVKNQTAATSNELSDLAGSRQAPSYKAANDTTLTHYHSFFYTLLSWEHPRATGLAFGSNLAFIFACRYLPVIPYLLKISYMTLGVVTLAEVAGKFVAGTSVTGSIRPRRYYKLPKESLEQSLDDLEQFINFFVIEVQRIVFAENVPVTAGAFITAFLSYYLVKILPLWGMAVLATSLIYLVPLVYVSNKELIDSQVEHASQVVSQQATQVKDITAQQAGRSYEAVKSYTGDYANKASEMMGSARQSISGAAAQTSDKVSAATAQASDKVSSATTQASNTLSNTTAQASDKISNTTAQASDKVNSTTSGSSLGQSNGTFNGGSSNPFTGTSTGSSTGPSTYAATGPSSTYASTGPSTYASTGASTAAPTGQYTGASTGLHSSTSNSSNVHASDFPSAPRSELPSAAEHTKPVVYTPTGDGRINVSGASS